MPVYLSARSARMAAKACMDAALNAERRADQAVSREMRLEYVATAKQFEALAEKFEAHARRPPQPRR